MLIDRYMPAYHFSEHHERRVHATADRAFAAIRDVTPEEIRFLRLLTSIRSLGRRRDVPRGRPLLEVAKRGGFLELDEEPGREMVLGTVGQFWRLYGNTQTGVATPQEFAAFDAPGFAKATINFTVSEEPEGWSRVTTETRIAATDRAAWRRFAAYWCVIRLGSALIRRMWLAAIRRRAEAVSARP